MKQCEFRKKIAEKKLFLSKDREKNNPNFRLRIAEKRDFCEMVAEKTRFWVKELLKKQAVYVKGSLKNIIFSPKDCEKMLFPSNDCVKKRKIRQMIPIYTPKMNRLVKKFSNQAATGYCEFAPILKNILYTKIHFKGEKTH